MNKFSVTTYKDLVKYDQVIKRKPYTAYYSYKEKGATCLWYKTSKKEVNAKPVKAVYRYQPDPLIPEEYRAVNKDYKSVKYHRGKLAPSSLFSGDKEAVTNLYYLTNVVPYTDHLQKHLIKELIIHEKNKTKELGYLYVVCLNRYDKETIGNGVGVPHYMYRVLINKSKGFLEIYRFKQNSKARNLKKYEITFEELMKDFGVNVK